MPRVSIARAESAATVPAPPGVHGGEHRALFARDKDPIHAHLHDLKPGATLSIAAGAIATIVYVWRGQVGAGAIDLPEGSSLIVEPGGVLVLAAGESGATLLGFTGTRPTVAGTGKVHLLPVDRVARMAPDIRSGTLGGMHADATCPGCAVWLHENSFPPLPEPLPPEALARGIHSHEEDEVIFVTDGQIRLGTRLYGPGTALAVAADTLYGFTAGPEGLRFINFRAGQPREIHFASGAVMDEVRYWRDRVGPVDYVEPA